MIVLKMERGSVGEETLQQKLLQVVPSFTAQKTIISFPQEPSVYQVLHPALLRILI